MKILCIGYRDWAINIYNHIKKNTKNHRVLIKKKDLSFKAIKKFNPDLILYYGWSNLIKKKIYENYFCLMLHPSNLPKFRGGSPIQNQIINSVEKSAVTIFKINKDIDGGPILKKHSLSLKDNISDIFLRIEVIGSKLTKEIIRGNYKLKKQNLKNTKVYKRLKPHQSEIKIEDFYRKDGKYLFNKIRMLGDPYPNAFIKTKDKKKIYFKKVSL